MWKFFSANIIKSIYGARSKVYPVCKANIGWESFLGLQDSKIKIIYNGVDTKLFRPMKVVRYSKRPTVVFVGRMRIFKDIVTLLKSVKYSMRINSGCSMSCLWCVRGQGLCQDSTITKRSNTGNKQ